MLIPYRPSITSEVEEPRPLVTFNTTHIHKERRKRKHIKSAPLYSPTQLESEMKQALYSTSLSDIQTLAEGRSGDVSRRSSAETTSGDPVLAFVVSQRMKLGLKTVAMKCPDKSESSSYRESLVATSAPMAGVKDLKLFSKRLSTLQDSHGKEKLAGIASEFVYALRRDSNAAVTFNPYDLYIVSPGTARCHSQHYTISAVSVTEVSPWVLLHTDQGCG